ncbi:MAG TPA: hypothetical protein VN541_06225 [Tepidisphaeraceae bacterium]|nr:hypothetical protein [Tepidisphaeraceae bacterium]
MHALNSVSELELSRTGVDNSCLESLSQLSSLKRLIVRQTAVTADGVRKSALAGRVEVVGAGVD